MELKRIITAYFSPTGGTKKVAMALQDGFLAGIPSLHPEIQSYNYLTPKMRQLKVPIFNSHDLLVLVFPVYYGRMPMALESWPELQGNGAHAIVVPVYGNRAIDDASRETMAMLTDHGFTVVGEIQALAEHSQERTMAENRPNEEDRNTLFEYAQEILKAYCPIHHEINEPSALSFDSTTPLRERMHLPIPPQPCPPESCDKCGHCVKLCPMGIINPETMLVSPQDYDKCMACRTCIRACVDHHRQFTPELAKMISERMAKIKAANSAPKSYCLNLG